MLTRKTTMWLFILLAVVSVATFIEYRHFPAKAIGDMPAAILPASVESALELSVKSSNAAIRCVRSGGKWEIVEPSRQRADTSRINFVIDTVARVALHDKVTLRQRRLRGLGLGEYGLVSPRATLTVSGPEGETELRIGNDAPGGDYVFVMSSRSSAIFTADRIVLDILPRAVEDFRDRALIPVSANDISGVEVRQPGKGIVTLERTSQGWRMTSPVEMRASMPAVNALLRSIENAGIEEFVWSSPDGGPQAARLLEEAGTAYGISVEESPLTASVRYNDGLGTANYTFGKSVPNRPGHVYVAASSENSICIVGQSILDAFRMDAETLREHRIFPLRAADAVSVSMQGADFAFGMRLDAQRSSWGIFRPSVQPADQQAASLFVATLLGLEDTSVSFPGESAGQSGSSTNSVDAISLEISPTPGLEPVSATIAYERDPQGAPTALRISIPGRNSDHIVSAEKIPAGFLSSASLAALRDKTVVQVAPSPVISIMRRMGAESETVSRNPGGVWNSSGGRRSPVDVAAVEKLLTVLSDMRALRVEALFSASTASYGLMPAEVELAVETGSPQTPVVILLLGKAAEGGGRYLQVRGGDAIFVVGPEVAEALSAPLTADFINKQKGDAK